MVIMLQGLRMPGHARSRSRSTCGEFQYRHPPIFVLQCSKSARHPGDGNGTRHSMLACFHTHRVTGTQGVLEWKFRRFGAKSPRVSLVGELAFPHVCAPLAPYLGLQIAVLGLPLARPAMPTSFVSAAPRKFAQGMNTQALSREQCCCPPLC